MTDAQWRGVPVAMTEFTLHLRRCVYFDSSNGIEEAAPEIRLELHDDALDAVQARVFGVLLAKAIAIMS